MYSKEQLADEVVGHIKKHQYDNIKLISTISKKISDGTVFNIEAQFDKPADINASFYHSFEKELIREFEKIENGNDWVIGITFSIFGGKRPNDLNLIAVYNNTIGFKLIYKIESDLSFLQSF